ncbi:MFS transporter [Bacillus sp. HSf4]|uniref:MFS transporter n=1 Tax=Bacillus sp. HSf4 TaxID=3035514 RepID=UPI00240A5DD2|nr:MFS transporter [Bacillus sp. HSf4]WFA03339.1 MFS transporter [Bacillus sp. HSf4]
MSDSRSQSIWKEKNFILIWTSQAAQSVGSIMMTVFVMVEIYKKTDSVFGSSLILALSSLGGFSGGALASLYIQRFKLDHIVSLANWFRAVTALFIGLCLSFGSPVQLMYPLLFLQSFIGSWYTPALSGLLYRAIEKRDYAAASGSIVTVNQFIQAAGWGIGGSLSAFLYTSLLVSITAGLFFVSGFLIRLLDKRAAPVAQNRKRPVHSGWRTLYKNKTVLLLTAMDLAEGLANAVWTSAILLAFTTAVLNKGESWWGFINAGYFLGAILGGVLVMLFSSRLQKRLGLMIALGALSMAMMTLLFAYSANPLLSVILCMLMGPLYQVRDVSQTVILQHSLTDEERAPLVAAQNTILTSWSILTVAFMGALADLTGVQNVYIFAAVMYLATAVLTLSAQPLRTYGRTVLHQSKEEKEI